MKNTRNMFLLIRINDEEREQIQARMELAGTKNMSAFIRKMALDGRLRRTSANVNQIAKRVNATSRVYENDLAEIQNRLGEVWAALDMVLRKLLEII